MRGAAISNRPQATVGQTSRWRLRLLVSLASALAVALLTWGGWSLWSWLRPPPPDRPLQEGLAAVSRRDFAAARERLSDLRAAPGREAEATFLRGAILLEKGYYYPALDELQQASQSPQLRLPALALTGQAWYRLGRHVEAQGALYEVLKHEPDSVDAHRWLAASCYDLGAIHDALVHLKRTAELDPTDPRPSRLLGLIYKDYERYDEAVPHYEESLRRKSDQADAAEIREELAACQVKLLRHQDALATLQPCPSSPATLVLRAECYHALGQLDKAQASVAEALAQDADNLDALLVHGTLLLEEGQAAEAVAVFERAAQSHPRDYAVQFKLSQAQARTGNADEAKAAHERAEQIRQVRLEFAKLHQQAWDRPRDMAVRMRLAELAKELGRPDLAEVWLKSAAALQPAQPEAK